MAIPKTPQQASRYEELKKESLTANTGLGSMTRNFAVPHGAYSQLTWVRDKIKEIKIKMVDYDEDSHEWNELNMKVRSLSRIEPEYEKLEGEAAAFFLQREVEDRITQERLEAENPVGAKKLAELRRKRWEEMQSRLEARTVVETGFNRHWFIEQLKKEGMNQRAFAKKLDLDPAAVSYMLSGRRRVTLDEAKKIADLFGVNTTEVMRNAGVQVTEDAPLIPLKGITVDGTQIIDLEGETLRRVIAPYDVSSRDYVVQDRTGSRPTDGWLYYISGQELNPANNLDHFALIKLSSGERIFGIPKKGYEAGQFNVLLGIDLKKTLTGQTIEYVSPVKWIKPSNITWAPGSSE
jgi:transcriptional regulator with XRE-family HTH domain